MKDSVYKKVDSIVFGLLSPKEIKKMASVKLVTAELYDKEGYPVDGGLMDSKLGVIDPGIRCRTCGQKLKECHGHFGYIELARPIVHVKFSKQILDVLRAFCKDCGRVLIDEEEIENNIRILGILEKTKGAEARRRRMKITFARMKNIKKCPHCNAKQLNYRIEPPTSFLENDKKLSPIEVKTRLDRIQERDLEAIGYNPRFAHPSWMILTVLQIPPVTMRPSITLESGERSEDDLTHKLSDIVRINQRLFENINAGAPEVIVEDLWDLLQYHVTTYFDNTITQIPPARHRSGQPLKTLTERIKSKEGRFRYNLAGKRVNFSARTVISPDPEIRFNEIGVPYEVAMELTVPERITDWNKEWVKNFVRNGPLTYPGANYVIRPDGKKKKITPETQETLLEELDNGYIVERHLIDKDIIIFNRQPSLHRMNIMCHRVKVLPYKSFRLSPAVCNPYAGDFDGDEMNLHVPQTEEAIAEADILMQVQNHIITPKNGTNIIGSPEDAITGNYLLTKYMTLTKEQAVNLLMSIGIEDLPKFKQEVSGREIFSVLLPKDFDFISETKAKTSIKIKGGQLVEGYIDERSIGEEKGELIRSLHSHYGEDATLRLMGDIFKLGIHVLLFRGFTTSLSDTDLNQEIKSKVNRALADAKKEAEDLIEQYNKKQLEALPSKTLEETLEALILQVLNKVRNKIGDLLSESLDENNPTVIMAKSGARGNMLNIAQMAACVGQQALRGKRIEIGYKGRTLSLFKRGELTPISKGFIDTGFKQGIGAREYFFHAMTGRDSLMDVALRTPKSGYLYRRLANALQDMKIEYDHTVRDANRMIVQFKYGDDGVDVSRSVNGSIDVKKIIKEVIGK
ncbi:MAG: DNA-directed RNA polymerase subunit A' [Candidatus Nanoarchaeia archaeon]|nr:DNA-directed RNA polymerase subunit A' [Candidatus Nanoarchaeia archaeon]